ncbi:hypothetical protein C8R44DRAFT_734104 [Mycena epipterygia]|nr:hypothetical protein C8R44DRAFT_734104 [Mycena epipterygia]
MCPRRLINTGSARTAIYPSGSWRCLCLPAPLSRHHLALMRAHPPLKAATSSKKLTDYEIGLQRHLAKNEKARLRMARKRAELKARPLTEQLLAAERERAYQATYREKNRRDLAIWERQRRHAVYKARFGPVAYASYVQALRDRKRQERQNQLAKEAYHEQDDDGEDEQDDDGENDGHGEDGTDDESGAGDDNDNDVVVAATLDCLNARDVGRHA